MNDYEKQLDDEIEEAEPSKVAAKTSVSVGPPSRQTVAIQASVTKTSTFTGSGVNIPGNAKMAIIFLDISAASGTSPTLDLTIEGQDPTSSNYAQIGVIAQQTAVSTTMISISPGGVTNNNNVLPHTIRAKATIGGTTPSFTYSVTAVVI